MLTNNPIHARMAAGVPAASEPPDYLLRRSFDDPDEQAASVQSFFPQRYHQVGAGPFAGEMTSIDLGGIVLFRERVNRRMIQEGSMNLWTIAWVPTRNGLFRFNGMDFDPERVMLYGERQEFEIACDTSEIVGMTIVPEVLTGLLVAAAGPAAKIANRLRFIPAAVAAPLYETVSRAFCTADANNDLPAGCREALCQKLIELALAVVELPDAPGRQRCHLTYTRVVRATKRAMNSGLAHSLSISELCRQIGVSRRNLFYAFESVLGISPHQYLQTIRLNAARRALKRGRADKRRIGDLAWEYGFSNPSQFAADYRRRFGELPSETALRLK